MPPKMPSKNAVAQKAAPKQAAPKPVEKRAAQAAVVAKKPATLKRKSYELEANDEEDDEEAEEDEEDEEDEEEDEDEEDEEEGEEDSGDEEAREAEEEEEVEEKEGEEEEDEDDEDMWSFSGEESDEEGEEGEEEEDGEAEEKEAGDDKNDEDDEFKQQSLVISLDPETKKKMMDKVTKAKDAFIKSKRTEVTPGVVYLGRIPHGFYEEQMKKFFRQFGNVTRLRISRNKKTGKSRHYAFIEFEFSEVAAIVAETMNNYLMFGSLIKAQVVPPEKIHRKMFYGSDQPRKKLDTRKGEMFRRAKPQTPQQHKKTVKKLLAGEAQKRQKLAMVGIEYDFPGYAATVPAKPKHQTFDD